jgi:ubiquinol-cytochrome c reductase iron-sulfur subunit
VPDFTAYRRDATKSPTANSRESDAGRKTYNYLLTSALAMSGAYAGKSIATEFVTSMSASADVMALAKIEIKLSDVPEGEHFICLRSFEIEMRDFNLEIFSFRLMI